MVARIPRNQVPRKGAKQQQQQNTQNSTTLKTI